MLKPDRFSCSQKIWLKWDPPVLFFPNKPLSERKHKVMDAYQIISTEEKMAEYEIIITLNIKEEEENEYLEEGELEEENIENKEKMRNTSFCDGHWNNS